MLDKKQRRNIAIISLAIIILSAILMYLVLLARTLKSMPLVFIKNKSIPMNIAGKAEAAGRKSEPSISSVSNSIVSQEGKAENGMHFPILLYHKTPDNFELQMQHLKEVGYTPVTMQEGYEIITKKSSGPPKPVAITFDDGFSDQLKAFDILKKYNFKATFYIIVGGNASDYCIGVEKSKNGCGDSYMNWNQIKTISDSGLIEIASHTIDHLQLSSLSPSMQKFQIFESKRILQERLGKQIYSFAYPYGKYNQTSVDLVAQAGYTNAAGVNASEYQSPKDILNLNRIRDTKDLK